MATSERFSLSALKDPPASPSRPGLRFPSWQAAGAETAKDKQVVDLAQQLGVHPLVAVLLRQRGLDDPAAARTFLAPSTSLESLPQVPGLQQAVEAVRCALEAGKRISVYGDYDVDGMAATAILLRLFRQLQCQVSWTIPDRLTEGYGLNSGRLRELAGGGGGLVIVVDTGTSAVAEVEEAASLNLDLVILDHHQPGPQLPSPAALVNPKCHPDWPYNQQWCAASLATQFGGQLLSSLGADGGAFTSSVTDLAAVALVADVIPLRGAARTLVACGLRKLANDPLPGLQALAEVAGLRQSISASTVAFQLAPRLNAAGRIGDPAGAVELLCSDEPQSVKQLAARLDTINNERRQLQQAALEEASAQVNDPPGPAIVVGSRQWHPGIVGIVAGRLASTLQRPVVALALDGSRARGSGRAPEGTDLLAGLEACSQYLQAFGGHQQAAGLELAVTHLDDFRRAFVNHFAGHVQEQRSLRYHAVVEPSWVDDSLMGQLDRLRPFGAGNPEPRFLACGLTVQAAKRVGRGDQHLQLRLRTGTGASTIRCIGFGQGDASLEPGQRVDVVFTPGRNRYRNQETLQWRLHDIRESEEDTVTGLPGDYRRDPGKYLKETLAAAWQELRRRHPNRQALSLVYRGMQKLSAAGQGVIALNDDYREHLSEGLDRRIPLVTLKAATRIFAELGLLQALQRGEDTVWVLSPDPPDSLVLQSSAWYRWGERAKRELQAIARQVDELPVDELEEALDQFESQYETWLEQEQQGSAAGGQGKG